MLLALVAREVANLDAEMDLEVWNPGENGIT
jgi:hypothetical protein